MKRIRVPGIIDLLIADERSEIESLAQGEKIDRCFADRSIAANGRIFAQVLDALQIGGKLFPTVSSKDAPGRAEAQEALWKRLSAMAPAYASGPDELEDLASFVRGSVPADRLGPLAQQAVGRLFVPDFKSTEESWNAALELAAAPGNMNPLEPVVQAITKNVDHAKRLLADMVGGDLAAVHAIGIAVHNIVNSVNLMQQLYGVASNRSALSPQAAGSRCLVAPDKVLRQPTAPDTAAHEQIGTGTLVMLKLQDANAKTPAADLVFMRNSWSRCPAEQWVPALLEGIWRRALQG